MYRLDWCSLVTICVLSTELQDGEQEDCGQDSDAAHKGNIYDSQIHISISGVCSPRGVVCSENKYKIERIAAHCNGGAARLQVKLVIFFLLSENIFDSAIGKSCVPTLFPWVITEAEFMDVNWQLVLPLNY